VIVTPQSMRACYDFLRKVSFQGLRLPASGRVTFKAKALAGYHGFYEYPEHIITVDSAGTCDIGHLLQIMAHEMCHVALEQNAACDHAEHDAHFKALAAIIEDEMGFPRGSV